MLRLVVTLCLVAAAAASCCSAGDQKNVKEAWNSFWDNSDSSSSKVIFGREVFDLFFVQFPGTEDLFKEVGVDDKGSPEFSGHIIRVLTGLDLVVNLLSEGDAFDAEVKHLNDQHLARPGLKTEYFNAFVDILTQTVPQVVENIDGLSFKNCLTFAVAKITQDLP